MGEKSQEKTARYESLNFSNIVASAQTIRARSFAIAARITERFPRHFPRVERQRQRSRARENIFEENPPIDPELAVLASEQSAGQCGNRTAAIRRAAVEKARAHIRLSFIVIANAASIRKTRKIIMRYDATRRAAARMVVGGVQHVFNIPIIRDRR
jgi:hypothetical protein